jgi:hypothetical protein
MPDPEVLPPTDDLGEEDRELEDSSALVKLNKGELEMQMEFARKYPRTLSKVLKTLEDRACHSPAIAMEMNYSLPRSGKQIMGASSRFAEILAASWGNCLTLCRVVGADQEFVRAQGVYFDCETNYRHGREVARRITDSNNKRFGADMIAVTGAAASSIAFRNATLNGIGKGIWYPAYLKSREVAIGNAESQVQQRDELLTWAKQSGITGEMLFSTLQVQGVQDIMGEKLLALKVMRKEVMAGEKSIDEVFGTMETANIEAAMTQLNWNEGQKTVSRQAYRGRSTEHLAYLKEQIDTAQKRGTSTAAPATKKEPAKTAPAKDAPKPASNAADAAETPRAEQTPVGGGSEAASSDGAETATALPEKKPAASTKGGKFDF